MVNFPEVRTLLNSVHSSKQYVTFSMILWRYIPDPIASLSLASRKSLPDLEYTLGFSSGSPPD